MKSAIMIRRTSPISVAKLPNKWDSEEYYKKLMLTSAKAECQAIMDTGKTYGPMTEAQQIASIEWAYDVKVTRL